MRRKMIFCILVLMFFSFIPACANADESNVADSCTQDMAPTIGKKLDAYQIRILGDQEHVCQRVEILKNDHVLFREEGFDHHYSYFRLRPKNHDARFVVKRFTGGAHCCTSFLIFDLGNKFRKIAEIDGGNFEPEIVDLDHDGIPEIRVTDDFLAYTFSDFGHSAIADVILKYKDGRYSIAPEFMKKPSPTPKALKVKIARWQKFLRQKKTPNWPPEKLIQDFTDLIYAGHKQMALMVLDQAWPEDVEGKSDFLRSYQESLAASKYYSKFEKIVSTNR